LVTAAADRPRERIWNRGPSKAGPAESALIRKDFWKKISAVWGWGWVGKVGWEVGGLGSSREAGFSTDWTMVLSSE
jgi:hypothetical protein